MFRAPAECETTQEYKSKYTPQQPPQASEQGGPAAASDESPPVLFSSASAFCSAVLQQVLSSQAVFFLSHIDWRIMSMKYICIQEEFLPSKVSLWIRLVELLALQ